MRSALELGPGRLGSRGGFIALWTKKPPLGDGEAELRFRRDALRTASGLCRGILWAMSQENVELVRAVHAAFNRGDVDEAFGAFAPEFECDMSRAIGLNVDQDRYDLAGFRRLVAEYAGTWETFELGPEEFLDAGDQVVTPFTNRARGRAGIEVQGRGTFVWTVHGGAITRACLFQERAEALEAAGLSENTMSQENVKTVQWVYERGHAQRTVDVPGVEDRVASDYRFHPRPDFPGRAVYGLQELVDFWADLDTTFTDYSLVPQNYEPIGPAHVLVTMRQTARLRGSDQSINELIYMLWHLVEGKLQETWTFTDRAEAIDAAGLSK